MILFIAFKVILSQASLDLAFHDTLYRVQLSPAAYGVSRYVVEIFLVTNVLTATYFRFSTKPTLISTPPSDEYYKMFFVGLMDGDGSIQVNH